MVTTAADAILAADSNGPFDLIDGLPVHALVVHVVVVLVPLTALGLLVMAALPRFSRRLGWLVSVSAAGAFGVAVVAKQAGEALEQRVGEPGFDHAELGEKMPAFAAGLLVVTLALWLIDRRAPAEAPNPRRRVRIWVAVLAVIVALANVLWVFRVGDSGARSVWTGPVAASEAASPTPSPSPSPPGSGSPATPSPSGSAAGSTPATASATTAAATYTMAQVAGHDTTADCWAAIDGSVYDLTDWIDQHPGGPERIIALCGTDATAEFEKQHAGERDPAAELAKLRVGQLAS